MRLAIFSALALVALTPGWAQTAAGSDLTEVSLEALFKMEVTTASKFSEKLSDAPGAMSVVTREELRRYGAMTLREALERVPSLVTTTNYLSDRSMISVRGAQTRDNGGHILFLINGRPVREVLDGGNVTDLLQSFPVNVLERIEVIRGPGSVLYGSNAFSGVINLITRKPVGSSAQMRAYSPEAGAGGVSGEFLFGRGRFNLVAAGQARYDPTWRTPYRFFPDIDYPGDFTGERPVSIPDRGPGAYVGVNYRGLRVMNSFTEAASSSFLRGSVGSSRWRRNFSNVGYSAAVTPNWDMSLDLTHTRSSLDITPSLATSQPPGPSILDLSRSSRDSVLEWSNVLRAGDSNKITFGALYNRTAGEELARAVPPAILVSRGSRDTLGWYAQIDRRLLEEVHVIGGLQSSKTIKGHQNTVPRVGLIWHPSSRVYVRGLYGKAFRAPSINESFLDHFALIGNPNLQVERVGTFDMGIGYQGSRLMASVNYFDSRESGIIQPGPTAGFAYQYANLGGAHLRGVEAEAKYYLSDRWFLHGSFLHNVHSAVPLPTPHWSGLAGASYQARHSFTLSVFDAFRGAVPEYLAGHNQAASSHHLLNAHARFELGRVLGDAARGMALFVHGDNLSNRQLWLPDWGTTTFETLPFRRGRTLYYGLEVSLFKE